MATIREVPAPSEAKYTAPDYGRVRDPDWWMDQLNYALASSAPQYAVTLLRDDLRFWTSAADSMIKALAARPLPELYWDRPRGGFHGYVYRAGDAALEVAERWARELQLTTVTDKGHGTREWTGDVDGWPVTVWCIVNGELFDGAS